MSLLSEKFEGNFIFKYFVRAHLFAYTEMVSSIANKDK